MQCLDEWTNTTSLNSKRFNQVFRYGIQKSNLSKLVKIKEIILMTQSSQLFLCWKDNSTFKRLYIYIKFRHLLSKLNKAGPGSSKKHMKKCISIDVIF